MTKSAFACTLLLLASGCKRPAETETSAAPVTSAPVQAPARPPQPSAPAAPSEGHAGGLSWQDAPPLERREPKSSMRAAEYGVSGDQKAELVVFYFGPDQGGSVEANVTRWLAQFRQPDGSDSAKKAIRKQREVSGISVHLLEVSGAYSGGMAPPGAPAPEPVPDATLLGAIAQGPGGPVFFKLVGPRPTIERARPAFDQMIGSLHPDTGGAHATGQ